MYPPFKTSGYGPGKHATLTHVRSPSDCESFLISKAAWVEPLTASKYRSLQEHLDVAKEFEPLLLNEYAPGNLIAYIIFCALLVRRVNRQSISDAK